MKKLGFRGKVLNRLTSLYVLLVLFPFLCVCIYVYAQMEQSFSKDIRADGERFSQQLLYDIADKVENAHIISNNLTYNSKIQELLREPFSIQGESLSLYRDQVIPITKEIISYNLKDIHRLFIFMENDDIPDGAGIFLSAWRIRDKPWFLEFQKADRKSDWFRTNKSTWYSSSNSQDKRDVLLFAQKITDFNGRYLGVVVLEVLSRDFLLPLRTTDEPDRLVYVYDDAGQLATTNEMHQQPLPDEVLTNAFSRKSQQFSHGAYFYTVNSIPELDFTLVNRMSLSNYRRVSRYAVTITIAVALLLIVSLIVFYGYIRYIFNNINKNIGIMKEAVNGNHEIRIPVRGQDELGAIAENFNSMIEMNNALIKDIVKKEVLQRTTQLRALQYQINPHFFYNTLDILSSHMVIAGHLDIADAIADFGKMLRYNMNDRSMYTTLEVELQYLSRYIRIQQLRYGDKVALCVALPDECRKIRIIKFILQPIVENSLMHGFSPMKDVLEINIRIQLQDARTLVIAVVDNGRGIGRDDLTEINQSLQAEEYAPISEGTGIRDRGIGLENINERLKLFYGDAYGIRIQSAPETGTVTTIIIPTDTMGRDVNGEPFDRG